MEEEVMEEKVMEPDYTTGELFFGKYTIDLTFISTNQNFFRSGGRRSGGQRAGVAAGNRRTGETGRGGDR